MDVNEYMKQSLSLLERIADPAAPTRRVTMRPELVIRSSCGAP